MTIGDEKAVAYEGRGRIEGCVGNWHKISKDEFDYHVTNPGHLYEVRALVTQSAYAELAADRDSWAEQAADRLKDWDAMRIRAEAAESQLAELRGKLEGLKGSWAKRVHFWCGKTDRLSHSQRVTLQECLDDVSALAAADGG